MVGSSNYLLPYLQLHLTNWEILESRLFPILLCPQALWLALNKCSINSDREYLSKKDSMRPRKIRSVPKVLYSPRSFICKMCTLSPLLTHLKRISNPGYAAPEAALAGWKGPQSERRCGVVRLTPAPPPASRAPRPLAARGSGRGPQRGALRPGAQRAACAERE